MMTLDLHTPPTIEQKAPICSAVSLNDCSIAQVLEMIRSGALPDLSCLEISVSPDGVQRYLCGGDWIIFKRGSNK